MKKKFVTKYKDVFQDISYTKRKLRQAYEDTMYEFPVQILRCNFARTSSKWYRHNTDAIIISESENSRGSKELRTRRLLRIGFQATVSGFGYYTYIKKNKKITCKILPGMIFIISPDVQHEYYFDSDEPWEFVWIHLYGLYAEKAVREILLKNGPVIKTTKESEAYKYMEEMAEIPKHPLKYNRYQRSGIAYNFVQNLLSFTNQNKKLKKGDILLTKSRNIVSENIADIRLDTLAENLGYSKYHLIRLFRKELGYTPQHLINLLRIQKACDYLENTNKKITEIARLCGFDTAMYFSRVFKKFKKTTPVKYRVSVS